jgi:hypothetical protein
LPGGASLRDKRHTDNLLRLKAQIKRLANFSELDYIKPTFAPLALANECLCLSDFLSKLSLRKASRTPSTSQDSKEHGVMI